MRRLAAVVLVLCSACTFPSAVRTIQEQSPPTELGRPGWVRAPADVASWIGGAVGAIASVVALPITLPISWVAEEQLGEDRDEFTWPFVSIGASVGQYLVGAPLDGLDFVFRRAWTEGKGNGVQSTIPQPAPVGPPPAALAPDAAAPDALAEQDG